MTLWDTPTLDPDNCWLSNHAVEQYRRRRGSDDPVAGLRRLLSKASLKPTPPLLKIGDHPFCRRVKACGFVFVFDADMSTLITVYADVRQPSQKGKKY